MNEGVEVFVGDYGSDDLPFLDNDSIEMDCVFP